MRTGNFFNVGLLLSCVLVANGSQAARLSSSPDWSAEGDQLNVQFGYSVSTAGDVNADGFSDAVVGAYHFDNGQSEEGGAFVFLGGAGGLNLTADWAAESDQNDAHFGHRVSTAGDVDGDGDSEVVIGAIDFSNGQTNEGRVFVFHGSTAGLSSGANWTAEADQADAGFGCAVSTAGDINADGYSDVIVGGSGYSSPENGEGRAWVFHGSASGLSLTADWTAESNQAGAQFGASVSTAGDVDGDGFCDVIIGADNYDGGHVGEGRASIYYGSSLGLSVSAGWSVESDQVGARLGHSVASAGDVNADGYADVIIGADAFDAGQTDEGRAFGFYGSSSGPSTTPDWAAEADQTNARFGISVAGAGDVDGDGYADVIVGADHYSNGQLEEGRAFVYLGSVIGLSLVEAWTGESDQAGAHYGFSVGHAGDVDGDGFSDVIVGSPDFANPDSLEGAAFVYHGSGVGLLGGWDWSAEGDQDDAVYGFAADGAGDVNGDGYADVIVGAFRYDNGQGDEGAAFAYHGSSAGLGASAVWSVESNQAVSEFGRSVAGAGDVDGDGYSDVIVGAPRYTAGQSNEGAAFLYRGSASGLSTSVYWSDEADQATAGYGRAVASAGDVNGDGYLDIAVGANAYTNDQALEGTAFVYHGSPTGPSLVADWSAESNQVASEYGWSLASAGDVNADGYSDLIVGAFRYANLDAGEGSAFVYHGSPSGLSLTSNWSAESNQNQALFGFSVAGAGDVNGDGYSDAIVGAYYYSNQETNEGRAYLFEGSATGLSTVASWTAESDQDTALFGRSVSSAGDVNGDGFSDVLVSATYWDNIQSLEGRIYLFHGSATGVSTAPEWTYESNQDFAYLGDSVSSAGDVNGDGYSDIITGAAQYDSGHSNEGVVYVFYGNNGPSLSMNPRQARADGSALTQLLNSSGSGDSVRLRLSARTPAGRTRARLVWETKALDTLFDMSGLGTGSWTDTALLGAELDELVDRLEPETPHHWRARLQYFPHLDYGRWFSIGPNGAQETDFRTGACQPVAADDTTCDGVDDDCDDLTDEDGDTECDDGLYCNGAETCHAILGCQPGSAPDCDDLVNCTTDGCDEANDACTSSPDDGLCDNGQYCDGAETCNAVTGCQAGTAPDCDNGLYCDGVEVCDNSTGCQAGSPVDCGDGVSCTDDTCDEVNDGCTNAPNDSLCDNGQYCDGAENCDAFAGCQAGAAPNCTDGVTCTVDSCDEANDQCSHAPDDAVCDDGDYCNGAESCESAGCQPGSAPDCTDSVTCTVDGCDEGGDVCTHTPDDSACNDGNVCTIDSCDVANDCQIVNDDGAACSIGDCDSTCQDGLCQGCTCTSASDCDDGVACTQDDCQASMCINLPDHASCSDGLWCNGAESCDPVAGCQAGSAPDCDDGVGCTSDACDEDADECQNTSNPASCDDAEFCNGSESCDLVLDCQPGIGPDCDDGIGCTTDTCDEQSHACQSELANGMCLIEGECQAAGADQPGNVCLACLPAESDSAWSPRPEGTACGESSCVEGVFTPAPECDGQGACLDQPSVPCESGTCNNAFDCTEVSEGLLLLSAGRGLELDTTVRADSPRIVFRLMMEADGVGGTLESLRLTFPGLEDVSFGLRQVHVRLYEDEDLDGQLDAGSRLLGQVWMDQAAVELSDLALSFQPGSRQQVLVEMSVVRAEDQSRALSTMAGILPPLSLLALALLIGLGPARRRRLLRATAAAGAILVLAVLPLACDDSSMQSATFETHAEVSANSDVVVSVETGKTLVVAGTPVVGDDFLLTLGD